MNKVRELGSGLRNNGFEMVNSRDLNNLPHISLPKDLKGTQCIERAKKFYGKCKCKIGTNRWPYTWSECNDSYCPVHSPQKEDSVQMSSRPGTLEILPKTEPFDETVNRSVKGVFNSLKDGVQRAKNSVSRVIKPKQPPKVEATERKIFNVGTMSYIKPNVERQIRRNNSLRPLEEVEEPRNNSEMNAQPLPTKQTSQSRNQNRQVSLSLRGIARQKLPRGAKRSAKKSTKRGAKGKKKHQNPKKTNKKKKQKPKKTNKKKSKK